MKKKIAAIISIMFMLSLFICCNNKDNEIQNKIGISLPDKEELSWNQEGCSMMHILTGEGYDVELQFAESDADKQTVQIRDMIESGCKIIVVAPVENEEQLVEVISLAKEKNITIISYKNLIMNSDAVSYFVTVDDSQTGYQQGRYIADSLGLDSGVVSQPYTIEIFAGNEGDEKAKQCYNDAMEILQPYIDSGMLVVPSGAIAYDDTVIKSEPGDDDYVTIQERMIDLINTYYCDELLLDAVYCTDDAAALEAATAIDYNYNGEFPIITGYGCTLESVKSISKSKQTMTIFTDTGLLANKTVEMIDAVLNKREVPVNDSESFNNGVITVPAYVFEAICIDEDNYEEKLIESGYYTESQIN